MNKMTDTEIEELEDRVKHLKERLDAVLAESEM